MDRRREVLREWLHGRLADRRTPLALLGVVCLFGVGLRAFHLGIPAASRPGQGYIFDEHYYVSAARIIAGERVTAGDVYAGTAPAGADPNGEHPQLGKMIIAAGIIAFGDNAIGWRITAVLFGAAAILLLYWLVRCAGGGPWLALGAASLASVDNLWVVHSRIAVLDIYVVPFMLAGVGFYLRRRPIVAGVVIGIGCCVKEFAAYAVFVLLSFDLLRALGRLWARRARAASATPAVANTSDSVLAIAATVGRALAVAVVATATYFSLLTALDKVATPYSDRHPVDRNQASVCQDFFVWSDACNHFAFMNRYAGKLRDVGAPRGIAARPLEFWLNRKAIPYFKVTQTVGAHGSARTTTVIWFRGEISRVLLVTSWFAILLTAWWAVRRRDDLSLLVLAWILGTWLPPELFNLIDGRTTYLYYMVVTMPALYIAVARLLAVRRIPRWVVGIWIVLLLFDAASLYPFRTLSGS